MKLLTLYARKEPTQDPASLMLKLKNRFDTALYRDKACTVLAVRWGWYLTGCPRRGQKRVTFNCRPGTSNGLVIRKRWHHE